VGFARGVCTRGVSHNGPGYQLAGQPRTSRHPLRDRAERSAVTPLCGMTVDTPDSTTPVAPCPTASHGSAGEARSAQCPHDTSTIDLQFFESRVAQNMRVIWGSSAPTRLGTARCRPAARNALDGTIPRSPTLRNSCCTVLLVVGVGCLTRSPLGLRATGPIGRQHAL